VTFNQNNQVVGTQTNIGSVAGDVTITAQTSQADIAKTIAALKAELAGLSGLPAKARKEVNDALDSAAAAGPGSRRAEVKEKLDNSGKTLETFAKQLDGADKVGEKALKLAKTIFSIGKWIAAAVL